MGSDDKRRVAARLEKDRVQCPDIFWPEWSGRSDIYVYFLAHATPFLKEGGRLVFITAGSWLDVGYGAPLREFLIKNFRIIAVIESAAESFFEDASINTAITVLEREPDPSKRESNLARFAQLKTPLAHVLDESKGFDAAIEFARSIEASDCSKTTATLRLRVVDQGELARNAQQGWGRFLRAEEVFFQVLARGGTSLTRLVDIARVRFGVKTGANEFFYVRGCSEESRLKPLGEVATVRRGLTTGANDFFYVRGIDGQQKPANQDARLSLVADRSGARHLIESQFLSPVLFSLKEVSGVLLDSVETGRFFFNCAADERELIGTKALEYIRAGESAGYHQRPTCSSRKPWYSVARGIKPAPLIFPSKVGERWVVALNRASVFEDKKLYGVFPAEGASEVVLAALLNSTWVRYCAEVTCRQMIGAQAIADIDVAVAEQVLVPDPRQLPRDLTSRLEAAFDELATRRVLPASEEVERADRRRLDSLVLEAMGFGDRAERESVLDSLYSAVISLVRARLEKSKR
jgi:hypothetical protein